jgi:hypothetical protein
MPRRSGLRVSAACGASSASSPAVGEAALWGIHLTGLTSPRAPGGRPFHTRWATAGTRWLAGRRAGSGVGDEVAVADGVVGGGELEHAVENEAAAARAAAVEAEHELVEVAGQVRRVDRALVGAQQPALGQRGDFRADEPIRPAQPLVQAVGVGPKPGLELAQGAWIVLSGLETGDPAILGRLDGYPTS